MSAYDLHDHSPRSSLDSNDDIKHNTVDATPMPQPTSPSIPPSIRLLFSFIPRRRLLLLVLPAILTSIIAGGVAPFMTYVVGQAFDAFAKFPLTPNPPQSAKDDLLHGVGIAALELIGLAIGALALSSITSSLWIWIGETNVMGLRKAIYTSVSQKDLSWFDNHMGSEEDVGAGGLMAKFSRETDEVRMASSLASGMLIQYLTTCITCLVLAFTRSWALTLVILSALPVLVIVQGLSQGFAAPLLAHEREQTGVAATIVDRAVAAISTVKAFNAANLEHTRASDIFVTLRLAARSLNKLWAVTSGVSQFVMMAMFVQGFWFGSKLVREGKISAGDVMAVFWACLIASSNLQMCVPQFIVLAKGKIGMAALLTLVEYDPSSPPSPRKIVPAKFAGGLALYNVSFAYPSRPTVPVLSDVSLFLPANDTTFIVGSSGSGKSTITHLLLKMYEPQRGLMNFDECDMALLDAEWLRAHVACVGQQGAAGVVIFDERSVYENIALAMHGHPNGQPSLKQVEDACRAALLHEFVRDLPQGYDTLLGGGAGVGLSGGQKQRLAIARALLRNPAVLILDEATSALDATSRILVFEAIKRWRHNKTTIVITHDLSQITAQDFVYVLKDGRVVEQGYRSDLEEVKADYDCDVGEFRKLMDAQRETGGFLPEKVEEEGVKKSLDLQEEEDKLDDMEDADKERPPYLKHQSLALRPMTFGAWMLDVVGDLTGTKSTAAATTTSNNDSQDWLDQPPRKRRPSSAQLPSGLRLNLPAEPSAAHTTSAANYARRYSLPPTPTSATFTVVANNYRKSTASSVEEFDKEKKTMEKSATTARQARPGLQRARTQWNGSNGALSYVKVEKSTEAAAQEQEEDEEPIPPFWALMRAAYASIPRKPLLFFGLAVCVLNGAMTPVFSFLLSRLLFEVSIGAQDTRAINLFGALVLGAAALEGFLLGLKYFVMESAGISWVTTLRQRAFGRILAQDRAWFDRARHSPARLVQILVKDGDDARDLVAVVWGQMVVVTAMLGVGLVWALVAGWQLTLAGVAIAPLFAGAMALQTKLVARCEVRNKRAREEVARGYYDTVINIRGIRSMSFDGVFKAQFDASVDKSLKTGIRGGFVEGCTYGVASGLIYFAEAALFYVGAVLIARGTYTYLQMVQVLNLVVFTVTIGSQLMGFTQKIAKAVQATADFTKLSGLDTTTHESYGTLCPELSGTISLNGVSFTYPERPLAPVLKNVNLRIRAGECVAIVGPSGSGKSTVAALLQRLYEPTAGSVTIGDVDTRLVDVAYLRDHVAVVSQQPHLFDASIADNIRYGHPAISEVDIRYAAKAANIHEFIMGLPQGYDTHVGENAALVSGGQAQRLQIARALVRPSRILILDECTSSLDTENAAAVLEAIYGVKEDNKEGGRTTVMITHNLEAMMMCDRIVVVQDGEVVEEGSYDWLMERKGVFASLARGGEWIG
ncbi:hypothetical protein CVT25_008266 [Psilocybe cyanescens]|uniref:P-loop containing nucleoside triphosphate hydrolase protein n=1 Tax=Psilocybe cyanescens TaxID=93625 RepID=A0A409XMP9_PSICY|nr:hypothetical protein CVT25_008266 [Psilocybe cyanescens]